MKTFFSSVFGRTNVRAVFMEYETVSARPWPQIQSEIVNSAAVFVLLGPHVEELHHTLAWIGSEATYAAAIGREVWVFEHEDFLCQVPILATVHYMVYRFDDAFENYIGSAVDSYDDVPVLTATLAGALHGLSLTANIPQPGAQAGGALVGAIMARDQAAQNRIRPMGTPAECPYSDCKHVFYCHNDFSKGLNLPCPVCRRPISFPAP